MSTGWKYLLVRSSDRELIGELPHADDRALSVDLNKSGAASLSLPTKDRITRSVWPWSTAIVAQHDDEWYWSGPVISRSTDMASGRMTVNAVSWFDRLMHMILAGVIPPTGVTYTNEDAGAIVSHLLAFAHAIDPLFPITMGSVQATQNRTITYGLDQNIGQAIIDLTALESGIDWYIDPLTLQLNIVERMGQDRPNCKWKFIGDGKSEDSNLSNVVEEVDGSVLVNDLWARGKVATGYQDDPVSKSRYGVFMESASLSDVVDTNILTAYVGAEIFYRSEPRVTYTMTPKPSSKANVPKLFRTFNLGDTGYLTARRDHIDVLDQAIRVFGASLSIQRSGTEVLTNLQTTAS